MTPVLAGLLDPFSLGTEGEDQGWIVLRLVLRSIGALGFVAALLVAVVRHFLRLCFDATRQEND